MRRKLNLKDSSGALAVEFALLAPPFLMLLLGGFQMAWNMHCAATVKWSLETSARDLMLNPSEDAGALKARMIALLAGRASASNLAVTITPDNSDPSGKLLVAASSYTTSVVIPFVPAIPLTFTASTSVPTL